METRAIKSANISCNHCIMAIKRAVGSLPGVESVEGDPGRKEVTVKYDPLKVSVDDINKAMTKAGYPPAQ